MNVAGIESEENVRRNRRRKVFIVVLYFVGAACAQSEFDAAIEQAIAREARLTAGHLVFRFTLSESGRTELGGAMAANVRSEVFIHYFWDDELRWRADVRDGDGTMLRSIVYDGTNVDTGDQVWEGDYFTRYSSDENGDTYRDVTWAQDVVEHHLFLFGGSERDSTAVQKFHPKPSNVESFNDGGDEYIRFEFNYPLRVPSDGEMVDRLKLLKESEKKLRSAITLNRTLGCLPKSSVSKSDQSLEAFDIVWEWSLPTGIGDSGWVPLVCERKSVEGSEGFMWKSELLLDQSIVGEAPSTELFHINLDDPAKRFVEYEEPYDDISFLERTLRRIRREVRSVMDSIFWTF